MQRETEPAERIILISTSMIGEAPSRTQGRSEWTEESVSRKSVGGRYNAAVSSTLIAA